MLDNVALTHWVSASQHETYALCPRKWGWYKLDCVEAGLPNKYAEKGLGVHKVAELWLREGVPPDISTEYGRIFSAGLKYLPPPGGMLVEQKFNFKTETAVYGGLWDVFVPPTQNFVKIVDHKTTSDFKWIKTAEDLKTNIQANIYAVAALCYVRDQGADISQVLLQMDWVYYRANANKPGVRVSRLYVIPDEKYLLEEEAEPGAILTQQKLADRFEEIEKVSGVMLEHHREGHKALDLGYNIEGCNAYGGCPYRGDPCKLTMQEKMRGYMAQQTLAERIAARKTTAKPEAQGSDLAARIAEAKKKQDKPAVAEAKPAAVAKPAAEEVSPAAKGKGTVTRPRALAKPKEEPAVNPPGEAEQLPLPLKASSDLRAVMASNIAAGIIVGGCAKPGDDFETNVAVISLDIADAILERV